jgi:hypothetical protein
MEKELENPGKKKKPFRPKPAHQAKSRARLPPLTYGPRLSALVSRARPLSLAHCLVGMICRRQLLHPLALPLSLCLAGLVASTEPFTLYSFAPWTLPVRSAFLAPAVDQRMRTRSRRRVSRP